MGKDAAARAGRQQKRDEQYLAREREERVQPPERVSLVASEVVRADELPGRMMA